MTRALFFIERSLFPMAMLVLYVAHGGGMSLLGAIALGYVGFRIFSYSVSATAWMLRPIGLQDLAWIPSVPTSLVLTWVILKIAQMGA